MERYPEYIYHGSEFKRPLEDEILDLPEKKRVVFLISRIVKLKSTEIGEAFDLCIKTKEKHICSAPKILKGNLDELADTKV